MRGLARVAGWCWVAFAVGAGASGCAGSAVRSDASSGGSSSAGNAGTPGSGTEGPSAAKFPDALAKLFCDAVEPCCASASLPFDRAACESLLSTSWARQIETPDGTVFDRAAGQRCLDSWASSMQHCGWLVPFPSGCDALVVGTTPLGSPCGEGRVCAATGGEAAFCSLNATGSGVCMLEPPPAHGTAGQSCKITCFDDYVCNGSDEGLPACYQPDGLYCSEDFDLPNAGTCVRRSALGSSCRASFECEPGDYCVIAPDAGYPAAGTCARRKADGQPCFDGDECTSGGCDGSCGYPPLATAHACLGISDSFK